MSHIMQILFSVTVLLTVAVLLNLILQLGSRASAAFRHRLWIASLVGAVVLPVLSAFMPHWSPFHPPFLVKKTMIIHTHTSPPYEINAETFESQSVQPIVIPQSQSIIHRHQTTKTEPPTTISTTAVFFAVWLFGTLVLSTHLFFSVRTVWKKTASLEPFCILGPQASCLPVCGMAPFASFFRFAMQAGSLRTQILNSGETGSVPFTFGVFRPVIVLPPDAVDWSDEQKRSILAHESAHIARRDPFWQIFANAVCALYWFHPLVWYAAHRIRVERELACDDAVLLQGEKPSTYAGILLDLAMTLKTKPIANNCTVAFFKRNALKNRIRSLLDPKVRRAPLGRIGTGVFLVAAIACVLFAATLSPFAKPQTEPVKQAEAIEQKNQEQTNPFSEKLALHDRKMEEIMIPLDTPKITIRGRVLNPDGSPAKQVFVDYKSLGVFQREKPQDTKYAGYSIDTSTRTAMTDKDGNFEFEEVIPAGANIALCASTSSTRGTEWKAPKEKISNPVVFVSRENPEEITLQLQEAVPVRGRAVCDNGQPAAERIISAKRLLHPLLGADILDSSGFFLELQTKTDENGNYTLYLPPGEFGIREIPDINHSLVREEARDNEKRTKVVLAKGDRDTKVDFTLPTPIHGRIVKEDGSDVDLSEVFCKAFRESTATDTHLQLHAKTSDKERDFTILHPPREGNIRITVLTKDKLWGAVETFSATQPPEFRTITLKPTATIKMRLFEKATGEPLRGKEMTGGLVSGSVERKNRMSFTFSQISATTDENGIITLRLPPGTGDYSFFVDSVPQFDEKQWTLKPNETVDLGDVSVDTHIDWIEKIKARRPQPPVEKPQMPLKPNESVDLLGEIQLPKEDRTILRIDERFKSSELTGRVEHADGTAAENVNVEFSVLKKLGKRPDGSPMWGISVSKANTDAQGAYHTTDSYPESNPERIITGQAYLKDAQGNLTPFVSKPAMLPVQGKEGQRIDFTLEKGVLVQGTCRDAQGNSLPDGIVFFSQDCDIPDGIMGEKKNDSKVQWSRSIETDENGKYRIYLPPGKYSVLLFKGGNNTILKEAEEIHEITSENPPTIDLIYSKPS